MFMSSSGLLLVSLFVLYQVHNSIVNTQATHRRTNGLAATRTRLQGIYGTQMHKL